jgi:putative resolvase
MKSKDALRILNVSRVTLSSYVKLGKIKITKLPNGYYDYDDQSIFNFIGNGQKVNIIYARVSTYKQKNDLQRQIDNITAFCNKNNFVIDKTFSEISSGIDLDRDQFNLLLHDVFKYKIDKIFISNKDRLTRLSFITLENIFKQFGTSIVVTSKDKDNQDKDQLFDELVSMMHFFSTKEYSNRRTKKINNNNNNSDSDSDSDDNINIKSQKNDKKKKK